MAVFKCKICGGTLEINVGETVATCEYCGTKQTLPKLDNEKKANLFDRANHFRRNNDFDKAMGIYEQILNEDTDDAESYWSIILCRYGIEYVEDPSSRKRVPTVNRAQFTSVFDDEDYKSAIKYADSYQKNIYETEAAVINEIQKGILGISQKEEPFDVFICYKETDNNGRRTQDSVLATELYHELAKEGFKVFFSRITLEDKLGVAYEPYIFAALHSAKVMVALGTKLEHFNAVWVKNEWSRYLSLIKNGANKILIPAYRDMDVYDLPEEFSHLQAQDMSKLGFMQDLVRGIKKIVSADGTSTNKETVVVQSAASGNASALVKRGFLALEDEEWAKADEFFEQALNQNAEDAQAYLGKLMAKLRVKSQDKLADCAEPFDTQNDYKKLLKFADANLKNTLLGYLNTINERNKNAEIEKVYQSAKAISNDNINSLFDQENAISLFESVIDWKDAKEQIEICRQRIETIQLEEEKHRIEQKKQQEQNKILLEKRANRNKKIAIITTIILAVVIVLNAVIIPNVKYNKALTLIDSDIVKAYETLVSLDGYKDSTEKASSIYEKYKTEKLKVADIGDYIYFGTYEQDNIVSNGKEDVMWRVLAKDENKILITSKYVLDNQPYNDEYPYVTWENCSLREWLNNYFLNTAFTDEEKNMIPSTILKNAGNPKYGTNGGNDTSDKIFILSIDEANRYFSSDKDRKCVPTDYAIEQGSSTVLFWCWLRSPGDTQKDAAGIDDDGSIFDSGNGVDRGISAVRPALWIDRTY